MNTNPHSHYPGVASPDDDAQSRFDAVLDRLAWESGHYYLWGEITDNDARLFHRWVIALVHAGQHETATLHINSGGGGVFAGSSVIQSIRHLQSHAIRVTAIIEGQAMSMASIILQAADYRVATPLSVLMVHGVSYWNRGDIKNAKVELKMIEALTQRITDLYVARAHGVYATREHWQTILESADPTYLLPAEAMAAGLIDAVLP